MKIWRLVSFFSLLAFAFSSRVANAVESGFMVGTRDNIVLLGDSITADGHYGQLIQNAVDARYPERQIRVLSRGSHGDTARGALKRVEIDVVQWRPSWVLINFGVNDVGQYTREEFLHHYETLINRISRDTSAKIAIVSPIYQDRDEEAPKMRDLVAGLMELATKYNALYIPVYETARRLRPTLPAGVKYAVDGSHPNAIGYQFFAQTILQAMKFPLDRKILELPVPVGRVAAAGAKNLVGQSFILRLPQPVQVQITAPDLAKGIAKRAAEPIKIDGKLNEWDKSAPMLLGRNEQMVWGVVSWPRDHFRARAYSTYDDDAWYFGIDVEDSVIRGGAMPRFVVARDCVEVCIDARPQGERVAKPDFIYPNKTQVAQLIVAPATDEVPQAMVYMGNGDKTFIEGTTVASSVTKLGYQIELRVPKAHFANTTLSAGAQIGLDFAVVDVDRDDNYLEANSLRWSGSTASSFSTREFGNLSLE
jgi:lysophospholipase L1-like esterase